MSLRRKTIAGVLAAVAMAAPSSGFGNPEASTALNACKAAPGSGSPLLDWSGIQNDSTTQPLTIACGESLNSQAATIDTITARLVDHSSSAITCQASIVANGVVQWTSGSASTTANAATVVQLTFTAPAGTAGKGFMSCTLPVKSGSNRSSVNGYEQTFFLPT